RKVEPGVLYERRSPRGEVAGRAIAEPAAAGLDVDALGDRALAERVAHVLPEPRRRTGGGRRVHEPPAAVLKQQPVGLVTGVDLQGDLERRVDPPRQLRELAELVRLDAVGGA